MSELESHVRSGGKIAENLEQLPVMMIDNEVVAVDTEFNAPFDFKPGKPSSLGVFLAPRTSARSIYRRLEVDEDHSRSGIVGRVVFNDSNGTVYRDIEVKGVGASGFHEGRAFVDRVEINPSGDQSGRTEGILNFAEAHKEFAYSKMFAKHGVRIARSIALIRLREIVDEDGKRITIEEATGRKILKSTDDPCLLVRAFGTRSRFTEVSNLVSDAQMKLAFEKLNDARMLVAQELSLQPASFTFADYLQWLTKMAAENLARLHRLGYIHGGISDHNITMDGRLTDLESAIRISSVAEEKSKSVNADRIRTMRALAAFAKNLGKILSHQQVNRDVLLRIRRLCLSVTYLFENQYNALRDR